MNADQLNCYVVQLEGKIKVNIVLDSSPELALAQVRQRYPNFQSAEAKVSQVCEPAILF